MEPTGAHDGADGVRAWHGTRGCVGEVGAGAEICGAALAQRRSEPKWLTANTQDAQQFRSRWPAGSRQSRMSQGVLLGQEEATQKRQEERRKTQHDRSKKKEGSTNTKGKQKQDLYIQTPDQPLLAAPYYLTSSI